MGRSLEPAAAAALIFLGALFLALNVAGFTVTIDDWWSLMIVIPGLVFFIPVVLVGDRPARRALAALIIPGNIITVTGLALLACSLSDHWEAWAYLWTLLVGAVGAGLVLASLIGDWGSGAVAVGRWLLVASLLGFLVFGLFFELLIFGGLLVRFWPVLLIAVGVVQLLWMLWPREKERLIRYDDRDR